MTDSDIKNLSQHANLEDILLMMKKEKVIKEKETFKTIDFYKPVSSKKCPDGYKGRVGIYEILNATETIKELIVKRASSDAIELQAKRDGMRTMIEDGFIKAAQGLTSIEEILRVIAE